MKTFSIYTTLVLLTLLLGCGRHNSWTTESGLRVKELVEGEGATPVEGDIVSINYKAWYLDGDQFDSTEKLGEPMRFVMGKGQLLPGLEEGVATMRRGGKRILVLPPELAYGKEGRPPVVPPNAWIKFEVEVVDIGSGPPPILPWNDAGKEITTTGTGLQYVDFEVGEGKSPTLGGTAVVHYSGFLGDGTLFDSSYNQGYPTEFEVSAKRLIPGFLEGIMTMREGGKRKLIIPPFLGYGSKGFGVTIPPDATLIYDVELLEVRP
jgi:FKBP-type peptidyl-prolyl cis-trans isomerase